MQCIKRKGMILSNNCVWHTEMAFSWQSHMRCYKLSQSCVALSCVEDDCLPTGGATVRSPRYGISCVAMAMKACMHTHTCNPRQGSGWQYLETLVPSLYHTAVCNLPLGAAWEPRWNTFGPTERRERARKRRDNYTHTHDVYLHWDKDVYCTFVSSTDMILSLASLTFSLFPHTLMCGSAGGEKRERETLKLAESMFSECRRW